MYIEKFIQKFRKIKMKTINALMKNLKIFIISIILCIMLLKILTCILTCTTNHYIQNTRKEIRKELEIYLEEKYEKEFSDPPIFYPYEYLPEKKKLYNSNLKYCYQKKYYFCDSKEGFEYEVTVRWESLFDPFNYKIVNTKNTYSRYFF